MLKLNNGTREQEQILEFTQMLSMRFLALEMEIEAGRQMAIDKTKIMKLIFIIWGFASLGKVYSQSCEMYEIENIPVYFYLEQNMKSYSKVNDSVSYSIEKTGPQCFLVEKLQKGIVIGSEEYKYNGKMRYKLFKVKKRNLDTVTLKREKKVICLLEPLSNISLLKRLNPMPLKYRKGIEDR